MPNYDLMTPEELDTPEYMSDTDELNKEKAIKFKKFVADITTSTEFLQAFRPAHVICEFISKEILDRTLVKQLIAGKHTMCPVAMTELITLTDQIEKKAFYAKYIVHVAYEIDRYMTGLEKVIYDFLIMKHGNYNKLCYE